MSAEPASIHVRTRFDGRVFVPDVPLDIPPGTTLEGDAKLPESPPQSPSVTQEEWLAFLDSVEGAWGDYDFVEPNELPYDAEEPID